MEWDMAESNRIIDSLVEVQLEGYMQTTMGQPTHSPSTDTTTSASESKEMVDHMVELELDRRRAEAMSEADRADADVDAFAEYVRAANLDYTCRNQGTNGDTINNSANDHHVTNDDKTSDGNKNTVLNTGRNHTCSNPPMTMTPFDTTVLDELEEEARSRVEAMVDQVNPYTYHYTHLHNSKTIYLTVNPSKPT